MKKPLSLALALMFALAASFGLAGCGGSSTKAPSSKSPNEVLAAAKGKMDDAKSWAMSLSTKSKPESGNAVLKAEGVGTHAPAWKGSVDVVLSGLSATVPIVAVDGTVYAKLPLTTSYAKLNPAQYDAPNPLDFMSTSDGLSSLITRMESPTKTGSSRQGSLVLTTYSGTLPGSAIKPIIPSASASKSYQTVFGIDQDGYLATVKVTGAFFSGMGDITYDLSISDYDQDVKITAP